jgi:hypothetical protein
MANGASRQVYVFTRDGRGQWLEAGRTEAIDDNLNPDFATAIRMPYRFEEVQALRFVVVDIDNPGEPMANQVAYVECP